jgi:hypothetical protein
VAAYLNNFIQEDAVDVEKKCGRQLSFIFLESENEQSQEANMVWAEMELGGRDIIDDFHERIRRTRRLYESSQQ